MITHFHSNFYLSEYDSLSQEEKPLLRTQKGYYKDTINSKSKYPDYIFTANPLIAMWLAP